MDITFGKLKKTHIVEVTTDDVLGYLDDEWAVEILRDIRALPPR